MKSINLEDYNLHAEFDIHKDLLIICWFDTFLDGYISWQEKPVGINKYRRDYPKLKNLELKNNSIVKYKDLEFVVTIQKETDWYNSTEKFFNLEVL